MSSCRPRRAMKTRLGSLIQISSTSGSSRKGWSGPKPETRAISSPTTAAGSATGTTAPVRLRSSWRRTTSSAIRRTRPASRWGSTPSERTLLAHLSVEHLDELAVRVLARHASSESPVPSGFLRDNLPTGGRLTHRRRLSLWTTLRSCSSFEGRRSRTGGDRPRCDRRGLGEFPHEVFLRQRELGLSRQESCKVYLDTWLAMWRTATKESHLPDGHHRDHDPSGHVAALVATRQLDFSTKHSDAL